MRYFHMAFYKDAQPRKMTRQDHLRREAERWDDEGSHYKKTGSTVHTAGPHTVPAGRGNFSSSGYKPAFRNTENKPSYRNNEGKPAFRNENSRPAPHTDTRKPELREKTVKPIPSAPALHSTQISPSENRFAAVPENLLSGRNPIREALKAGRDIEKLLVAKGELSGSAREIVMLAKERHIPVQIVERTRLDEITHNHQGMLAFASAYRYAEVDDMLEEARAKGESPFLIILDGVTDPMNLGAIIRTAACVGAHGVILPERRAAGLTPSAVKASAGAVEVVKVARVTNLNRTLEFLKQRGIWLYAADMKGEDYRKVDFSGPAALIIGGEGEGVSRLILENCDRTVALPMSGKLDSLNASVAAGVLMYAMMNGRQ